eukprot:TRINITY_DN54603_c0_g1_i1.p1 TRINITY_DN54603_c0_g1~~TRINITY_DN54603_c0_g1_i1.p1  ORF type:complete len:412 (-),score=91.41 TRINITY_DN54603_c0_g1_i1:107-1342(-)
MDVHEAKKKLYTFKATVKGYPEIKTRVKVATNLDPWGPTTEQMKEICDACHGYEDKKLIMKALWKRITTSSNKDWPHIYKALAIFEYLLLHGPESVAVDVQQQAYNLKTLHDFQSVDEKGKDNGLAIREKSKKIVEWVSNTAILQEERSKATALQDRLRGIASAGGSSNTVSRVDSDDERPTFHERRRSVSPTPAPAAETTNTSQARAALFEDSMPLDQLANDQAYVAEQRQIMESFKPQPEVTPAVPKPQPKTAPPPPPPTQPQVDIDDFFGSGVSASKPAAPAPSFEDDIFGPSTIASAPVAPPPAAAADPFSQPAQQTAPAKQGDALFGDPFWATSGAAPKPAAQPTGFDSTFDALCNLNDITGTKTAAVAPPPSSAPVALNELKKQKQFEAQMQSSLASNNDNPFAW